MLNNKVELLSGGQKARLLMVIAAIDDPHILILDEPTNHLDIESREA
jgi:ATP-binding cassette subfamily F protein 3